MRLISYLLSLIGGVFPLVSALSAAPPAQKSGLGPRALNGPLANTPTEVIRTIRKNLGDGHFISIEKTTEHGQVLYEVEIHKDGHDRVFYIDEKGSLASYEVFASELPPIVRQQMQTHLKGEKPVYIGRITDEDGVSFEVETRPNGKKKEYTFDDKGVWYGITIRPLDVPPNVRKAFRKLEPEAKLVQVDKVIEKNKVYYEFEIVSGTKENTLWIDSNGQLMPDEQANH